MSGPLGEPQAGSWPLVTVGLPVYNGEKYLEQALEALAKQDYPNLKIVVADNASTDSTPDIVAKFVDADTRFTVLRSDANHGAIWNFNRLVTEAHSEYFKWMAYDDVIEPSFVSACTQALLADPAAVLAYPKTRLIDDAGKPAGTFEDEMHLSENDAANRLSHFLATRTEYHPLFGVMRREALLKTGLLGTFCGGDVHLLAQLAVLGRWIEVPQRLFARRFHANTSMLAFPDPQDLAVWIDPSNENKLALPKVQIAFNIFKSLWTLQLSTAVRFRCAEALVRRWCVPYWRHMLGELRIAIRVKARMMRARRLAKQS